MHETLPIQTIDSACGLLVDSDVELHGHIQGGLVVASGAYLKLCGTASCDLTVLAGGRAEIHGWVAGNVCNMGGNVTIFGSVDGVRNERPGAVTRLARGASVGGDFVEKRRFSRY
ncbi:hypothetical protein SLNSH_01660 [Alsobacter soli]|uniref:Cell shape determination protein CcmA n=1 Tax=Alsobacter soli TaxID=2109933 RepID=A0A2T1HXX9_9HYPH|nr:hypothetical protein [Alsobacter soli]PSC06546.1 hypothetical protein SLNSH_01660 [Alsobacter soli]